jgi:hypothetical protein
MSTGLLIYTSVHVILSLAGIGAGFAVIYGFLTAKRLEEWAAVFLATTVLTSVTGFFFPVDHLTPGHAIGILSLLALGPALWARYRVHMAGRWRTTFVLCSVIAQYLNFAVLIIQLFLKVPALQALAPTQAEPPFLATQLVVLAIFVGLAIACVRRFRDPFGQRSGAPTNVAVIS